MTSAERELEAEAVADVVAARNEVDSKSQTYLAGFVKQTTTVEELDVYQILRAAGQVEMLLGLSSHTKFGSPRR